MSHEEWTVAMAMLPVVTEAVASFPAAAMLARLNHAESIAPIVDPTLFRDYLRSDGHRFLKPQLRALADAASAIEKIRTEATS